MVDEDKDAVMFKINRILFELRELLDILRVGKELSCFFH